MNFRELREMYFSKNAKHFAIWNKEGSLNSCLMKSGLENRPGVYIVESAIDFSEVVYIGRAGTWNNSKRGFQYQGLLGRLTNRQGDKNRAHFFAEMLANCGWQSMRFSWCNLDEMSRPVLPAKVEADLMQAYLDEHGRLPRWNKSY